MERTLKNNLSTGRKMDLFISHLKNGGEINVNGNTYVWLDNHVTKEVKNDDGTTDYFGINGLAIKTTSYDTITKVTSPWFFSQNDLTLLSFIDILDSIGELEWFSITATSALQSMIPDRS